MIGEQESDRRERFARLYESNRVEILAYLMRRTPRREDAADVLADVYLAAWRRIDDIPAGDVARLWLYATARNMLANHRRRDHSERGIADGLRDELRAIAARDATPPSTDARIAALHEALGGLEPDQRELLTLTAWEGLTPREIAIMTAQTAGAVRVQLHRARQQLRLRLVRLGVETDNEPRELLAIRSSPS